MDGPEGPLWTATPAHSIALAALGAAGAALGALLRTYVTDACALRQWRIWLGVLLVNAAGSAAAGAAAASLQSGTFMWAAVSVGALGGLTTLSAVAWESVALVIERRRLEAVAMVALNVVLCPCAAWAGMRVMS